MWTLIVAGLAAAFSLGSAVYTGWFSRRSEHKIWQRDLRVRIYGECAYVAEELLHLLTSYTENRHTASSNQVSTELEHIAKVRQLRIEMVGKGSEVYTFGAEDVLETTKALVEAVYGACSAIVSEEMPDIKMVRSELAKVGLTIANFRMSVRGSLKISQD